MLLPGSKGWIKKYFELVHRKEITLEIPLFPSDKQHLKHLIFSQTGIVFGYPSDFIFAKEFHSRENKWTFDEQLTFLLFECHLYVYVSNGGIIDEKPDDFIQSLLDFYENHSVKSLSRILTFYLKESPDEKLEKLLEKRTEIRKNLLENAIWVNYLSNTFVYLDVILYDEFLRTKRSLELSNYDTYAENALYALTLAAHADGKIDLKEKRLFEVFLASAKIPEKKKEEIENLFHADIPLAIISKESLKNELFRRFLLDISVLTIFATHDDTHPEEKTYLRFFCEYLNITDTALNETLVMVENFVLKHNEEIAFLANSNSVEKLYGNVSKRWINILGRNKDKLAKELQQSKELVFLIKKSTRHELSKEEKEKVKTQFLDLVKSMPALAIFLLPGGAILLPIVLKIIPDLIPSAFRDNELDE
ncbi:MAG: hypothetical protein K0R65_1294 [Crocinitomicaceae bacterium]|jgi:hypothetical protein|nr:hypothetical protein [Crocinitomicaceae bacterium]